MMSLFNMMLVVMISKSLMKLAQRFKNDNRAEDDPAKTANTTEDVEETNRAGEGNRLPTLLRKRIQSYAEDEKNLDCYKTAMETSGHSDSDTTCDSSRR